MFIIAAKIDELKQFGDKLSEPARQPPIKGPIANPKLYAELNLPTCLVLSSEVVRSETYAEPTEILQEKRPAINLEAKSNGSVLAKDIIK